MGADGGRTGGGGQGGLTCRHVRSWQARAAAGMWQLVVVAVAATAVAAMTGAATVMVAAVAAAERQRRPQGRIVGRRCPPPLWTSLLGEAWECET